MTQFLESGLLESDTVQSRRRLPKVLGETAVATFGTVDGMS
jgi:hypothetical protein